MKFTGFKTSFKGGMVSPRLRGRQKEGEIVSSVEKLENFIVDRVGSVTRRVGFEYPLRQPYKSTTYGVDTYDSHALPSLNYNAEYFAVELRGRLFQFRFSPSVAFNSISGTNNPSTVAHYQSSFLKVIEINPTQSVIFRGDSGYRDVRPFAPYTTGTPVYTLNPDLTAFSVSAGIGTTHIAEYLQRLFVSQLTISKVTDSTVIFSSRTGIGIQGISFSVSLIDLPVTSGSTSTTQVFVILPYFVNIRTFVANLGKSVSATDYYCPILPMNFPFNAVNTNPSYTVSAVVYPGQTGADGTNGVLTNNINKLLYQVAIPLNACIDANYPYGTNTDSLIGKFIIIPTTNNLQDIALFITAHEITTAGIAYFYAIRVTGGDSVAGNPYGSSVNTTLWKVSSFGGQAHPKAINFAFGRLMYANDGINQSRWWASAVHPTIPIDFQGFMGFSLLQDASSDVSKMGYEGIATAAIKVNYQDYGIVDPYRYGFTSRVPNLSPINFIESRSRIHMGTASGEVQVVVGNGTFDRASYEQTIIRTNSAELYATTRGDGKFFYISNGGRDVRYISTEDKYYESLDGLMTTALEGIDLIFYKIGWYEKLNCIVALAYDDTLTKRIFFITVHEDTQIKAISELKTAFTGILDFFCTEEYLYLVVDHKGYQIVTRYLNDFGQKFSGEFCWLHGGFFSSLDVLYPPFIGDTMYILFNGIEYSFIVPANGSAPTLPVDPTTATDSNPLFIYGKKVMSKIKTLPIDEGSRLGTAVGDVHRIDQLTLMIDNSGPFRAGNESGTIYDVEGLPLSPLSTKYVKFDFPQTSDDENHFYIETDKPTPLNISGVAYRGKSDDGV